MRDDLEAWRKTKQYLEEQRARYGIAVPVSVLHGLAQADAAIKRIEAELDSGESPPVTEPGAIGVSPVEVEMAVLREQVLDLERRVTTLDNNGRLDKLERMIFWLALSQMGLAGISISALAMHFIR